MNAPEVCIKVRAFLTMRPVECVTDPSLQAERGLIFTGRDTSGLLAGDFCALWVGPAAIEFHREHFEELKPGRSIDLEVYGIKPHNHELRAHVKTCALAPLPPSWIKHAEKAHPPTTEQQAT